MTLDLPTPPAPAPPAPAEPPTGRRAAPWLVVLLAMVALALGAYVALQVIGVLYGIAAPPLPPLPAERREISHLNRAYGVDTWMFSLNSEACDTLAFYQQAGAQCAIAPLQCTGSGQPREEFQVDNTLVARCNGSTDFSIFTMSWSIFIARPVGAPQTTQLEVSREVYWTVNPSSTAAP
jgi:hypothetical protein